MSDKEKFIKAIKLMSECSRETLEKEAFHSYYEHLYVCDLIEILEDVVVRGEGYRCGEYTS